MKVLKAVEDVNDRQKAVLFDKLRRHLGDDLRGRTVAMWGLSFKPETDDMREAPSLVLIDLLTQAGVKVRAYDPIAMDESRRRIGDRVEYTDDKYDAVEGADALMLVTEWKEFRVPDWHLLKERMSGTVILDGRNIYDRTELTGLGFTYEGIG